MSVSKKLETQALCPHSSRSKEVMMGQKTGDTICNDCHEVFMPSEKILPPEQRCEMVLSVHALHIAIRANSSLELISNYDAKHIGVYEWALVDANNDIAIPVMANVADEAISAGIVKI